MKKLLSIAKISCFLVLATFCVNALTAYEKISFLEKEFSRISLEKARQELSRAIHKGNIDKVKSLIEKNKELIDKPRTDYDEYYTPLYEAVDYKKIDIVRLLIQSGAKLEVDKEDSPLFIAVENGFNDIAKLLIQSGANCSFINNDWKKSVLLIATERNNLNIVKLLIQHGANPNDEKVLKTAYTNNYYEITDYLEKSGAKITADQLLADIIIGYTKQVVSNYKSYKSKTLPSLLEKNLTNINRLLKESNFEKNSGLLLLALYSKSMHEVPALLHQQMFDFINPIAMLLINSGIDINAQGPKHRAPNRSITFQSKASPLLLAIDIKNYAIAKVLLEKGANINSVNEWGFTPLIAAVHRNDYDMVKLLLTYHPDLHKKTKINVNMKYYGDNAFYGTTVAILKKDSTALSIAKQLKYSAIHALLVTAGADSSSYWPF